MQTSLSIWDRKLLTEVIGTLLALELDQNIAPAHKKRLQDCIEYLKEVKDRGYLAKV